MRDYKLLAEGLRYCSKHVCNKECGYYEICHRERGKEYPSVTSVGFDAADAIEELLAAVPTWISVEERLPEDSVPVLATYRGYNTGEMAADLIVCLFEGTWCYWDGYPCDYDECCVVITHWMPLPAPPKGVE